MTPSKSDPKIIVALDFASSKEALAWVDPINPKVCRVKVGKELFTSAGPSLIEALQKKGFEVFLDLKFHDIPTTVARACTVAAELGVWMVNVHVLGGRKMLEAAKTALTSFRKPPLLIGVTLLTSLSESDLSEIGFNTSLQGEATLLARLAVDAGLDGVVCAGTELSLFKTFCPNHFLFVVPGIRVLGDKTNDQMRVMTPKDAFAAGASYLVIGRSLTQAPDPSLRLREIMQTIDS